jgi:putative cardiolipin synthase
MTPVLDQPLNQIEVVVLLRPEHPRQRLTVHAPFIFVQRVRRTSRLEFVSADTRLGRAVTPLVAAHPGRSGFYLLNNGIEALAARLLTAHRAERTLDVQYYLLHADLTGHVFVEQLLKAADRGVRVRLLLDDLTAKGYDVGLAALDFPPTHRGPHLQPLLTSHGPVVGLRD